MSVAETISPVSLSGTPAAAMPTPAIATPSASARSSWRTAKATMRFFRSSPPRAASVGISQRAVTSGLPFAPAFAFALAGNVTNPEATLVPPMSKAR